MNIEEFKQQWTKAVEQNHGDRRGIVLNNHDVIYATNYTVRSESRGLITLFWSYNSIIAEIYVDTVIGIE